MDKLKIAINGGGVGGLSAAIALRQFGHDVTVFEQTARFTRVGADVNLTPNAVHAADGLGVGNALRAVSARPDFRISRMWDTGEETSRLAMSDTADEKYGAPQLTVHRADLLKALEERLDGSVFAMGRQGRSVSEDENTVFLEFADGDRMSFDVLIGADGIHSAVRTSVFGPESPEFTGVVSYRATFPIEAAEGLSDVGSFTKWWGPEPSRQIVTFPLSGGREIFVFATTPQDDWLEESWTSPGDVQELREAYADFHPKARALLAACSDVTKSALYVREPMPRWSKGRVTLLGDAAHPMTPFMAQGAGQAIEDAVVLARCLAGVGPDAVEAALRRYEAARQTRTAQIQRASRGNEWLKKGGDADWVYGYRAWDVKI
ncbi:MAG: FAD-dependent monooxygenase [Alphaproteobacteria bacterium]|nr:FAD-dependent monooxygenase [Alphaproteobacteria bacterium]